MQQDREHIDYLSRFYSTSTNAGGTTSNAGTSTELYFSTAHNLLHVYVDSSHEAIQIVHQACVCSFE